MFALLATAILVALVVPRLLPQHRLSPPTAISLWLSVLGLRAVVAIALVSVIVLYLPATELFGLVTHWCLHAVIPFVATHLGFDGHRIGDAATLVPALVVAASVLSVGVGIWRGTRAARRWLRTSSLGPGPYASVIVEGPEVVIAAAGLRQPKVVVSAGALMQLDDAELSAGLEHEWGHVARRHRFIGIAGRLLAGVSRLLPGSRSALRSLLFALERDADEYAVRRTGDRLALASAICKAAGAGQTQIAIARLGGTGAAERIRLLADERADISPAGEWVARGLATAAATIALAILLAVPTLTSAGIAIANTTEPDRAVACD